MTIVEECSSALVGVGATMAPSSQVWNGIWAALVIAASASIAVGNITALGAIWPSETKRSSSITLEVTPMKMRAIWNAMPPMRFIQIWRNALCVASGVRV